MILKKLYDMMAIVFSLGMYVLGIVSGILLLAEYQRRNKKKKGSKKVLLKG